MARQVPDLTFATLAGIIEGKNYPELPPRERSFLRALVHHDYQEHRVEISRLQIWCTRHHPGKDVIVIFNYTSPGGEDSKPGGVDIPVRPKSHLVPQDYLEAELPMRWGQQARSKGPGRMVMHSRGELLGTTTIPVAGIQRGISVGTRRSRSVDGRDVRTAVGK
ncbi:hypothetical protein C8F04DRAFT_1237719 [Mycena alexandri]|uniref:Uncharacterized protein n=1 Tax=Mycena alexandri TaxID=1745969 RepID=A0AAD6SIC8_9AGAR|nr:hypothetical protein C8F04DRAFT_1237719 [Mycena alexandri]